MFQTTPVMPGVVISQELCYPCALKEAERLTSELQIAKQHLAAVVYRSCSGYTEVDYPSSHHSYTLEVSTLLDRVTFLSKW